MKLLLLLLHAPAGTFTFGKPVTYFTKPSTSIVTSTQKGASDCDEAIKVNQIKGINTSAIISDLNDWQIGIIFNTSA